jgi:16S rRNA G966 N2-methylase RsmD
MARALLNYIYPQERGTVMDNFAGSGTLLVEASFMELDSMGVEINPLSVLMSNVKCNSLLVDTKILKEELESYFNKVREALTVYLNRKKGQLSLIHNLNIDFQEIEEKAKRLSAELKDNYLKNKDEVIPQVLICKKLLSTVNNAQVREFLLLALSGTISDIARRTKEEFQTVFRKRVNDLYLRLYLFQKLNEILSVKVGKSKTYEENYFYF